jgi:hypothetical protein
VSQLCANPLPGEQSDPKPLADDVVTFGRDVPMGEAGKRGGFSPSWGYEAA